MVKEFKLKPGDNLITSKFTTTMPELESSRAFFSKQEKISLFSKRSGLLVAL
jgi:hypothetical protein